MKAFDAIVASASMALEHFSITFKLYLTLMLVYVRTILTVVAFLLFPIALSAILTYATVAMVKIFFIGLLGVLGLGFIVFISHLNSVLEIFVETLWYRAYIENKKSGSGIYK
jgi:ABC-type transport system involved in multi-copper enzyme maturation permease subunit